MIQNQIVVTVVVYVGAIVVVMVVDVDAAGCTPPTTFPFGKYSDQSAIDEP